MFGKICMRKYKTILKMIRVFRTKHKIIETEILQKDQQRKEYLSQKAENIAEGVVLMVGSIDFTLGLVVDGNILHVGVGDEEGVFIFDWAVEWITEWKVIHVTMTAANSSRVNLIVSRFLGGLGVWTDVEEELVVETSLGTLGEDEASWESVVSLGHVQVEFFVSLKSRHNVLVEGAPGGAVLDGFSFMRVALNDVLARGHVVGEFVELNKVHPVVGDWNFMTKFIILGTDEDADHNVMFLVALDGHLVGECFVVEAPLAGTDMEAVGVEFLLVDVQGVGKIKVIMIEVGDQLVEVDILNLNSWIVQLAVAVGWQVLLVLEEVVDDPLVELPEDWITHAGLEVFHGTWDDLVFVNWVWRVTENLVGDNLEDSIEAGVGRVWASFNDLAKVFKAFWFVQVDLVAIFSEDESKVNGITDPPLVVFNFLDVENAVVTSSSERLVVRVVHKMSISWPD